MELRQSGLAGLQQRDWPFVCSKLSKTILITKSLCVAYDTERISSIDLISILFCPGIMGFRKGAKPDFCFLEFSYYYEHPRI